MAAQSVIDYLAGQPFFADLGADRLDYLGRHATWRELESNEIVFDHGGPARHFFLLYGGQVVIEVPAIAGPSLLVQNLGAGEILGWSWLIPPYQWSFRARATEPGRVIEFDGETIREHCELDPGFGYVLVKRFARLMSERLTAARATMIEEWNPPGFA